MMGTVGNFVDAVGWLVACAVGVTVALSVALARRAWMRQQWLIAAGWFAVSLTLVAAAIVDADQIRPDLVSRSLIGSGGWHLSLFELAWLVGTPVLGGFLFSQARSNRLARWCVVAAIVCALANPLTEMIEEQLISDPYNYAFVASDQPYRFIAGSSRHLDDVTTIQEFSESLGALMLLAGIGLVARRPYQPRDS
jgi:hypothetical protein